VATAAPLRRGGDPAFAKLEAADHEAAKASRDAASIGEDLKDFIQAASSKGTIGSNDLAGHLKVLQKTLDNHQIGTDLRSSLTDAAAADQMEEATPTNAAAKVEAAAKDLLVAGQSAEKARAAVNTQSTLLQKSIDKRSSDSNTNIMDVSTSAAWVQRDVTRMKKLEQGLEKLGDTMATAHKQAHKDAGDADLKWNN